MIRPSAWANFKKAINDIHEDFNQLDVIWRKRGKELNRFGEDTGKTYSNIPLKVLIQGNYFRSWPMGEETHAGEKDEQSITIFINKKYLNDLGYINADGYFQFDPTEDFFLIHGKTYRAKGDTPVANAHDEPLLFMINLQRENLETGDSMNDA